MERRLALAECRALNAKAGGKEINAFAGKLRPEQRETSRHSNYTLLYIAVGLYRNLGGPGDGTGDDAVILVDGPRIVTELIKRPYPRPACESHGKPANALQACMDWCWMRTPNSWPTSERGWIWAVYYTQE